MDAGSFDRLTRLFAGRLTRRVGLAGALGALAAGLPAAERELEARRRDRARDRRGEGGGDDRDGEVDDEKKPCGPKPRDNRCRKHKDCCTKFCRKPKKGQRFGRCRCIKPGKKCKSRQTCCGGARCENRRCTPQPVAPVCAAVGGGCAADANCCSGLLCKSGQCKACGPVGGACAADADCCSGLICEAGLCAPCVEKVCASGCDFDKVNDAYAAATSGDTIYIGPGTYETGIQLTKDITLAACPGVTGVILTPDRVLQVDSYYGVLTEDQVDTTTRHKATVRNLTFKPTADGIANEDEAYLISFAKGLIDWTIEGCAFSDAVYGMYATMGQHVARNSTFTGFVSAGLYNEQEYDSTDVITLTISGCSFTDGDSYGVYFYPYDGNASKAELSITDSTFSGNAGYQLYAVGETANLARQTFTITNSTFKDGESYGVYLDNAWALIKGCTISGHQASGIYVYDCDATVTDCLIEGNTGDNDGGGIYVEANFEDASVTLTGTTMVKGNFAKAGGLGAGIYLNQNPGVAATASGTSTSNVTGNTPDNCYLWVDGNPGASGVKNCNTWT